MRTRIASEILNGAPRMAKATNKLSSLADEHKNGTLMTSHFHLQHNMRTQNGKPRALHKYVARAFAFAFAFAAARVATTDNKSVSERPRAFSRRRWRFLFSSLISLLMFCSEQCRKPSQPMERMTRSTRAPQFETY